MCIRDRIWIDADPKSRTLTVRDNGIGMSREEAIAQLGTIAKSGTAEFFKRLTGDQQKDAALIGQFGVGFYSCFMVAERVEVFSRRAGTAAEQAVRWESSADGQFTVQTITREERGTSVVLHLKEEAKEFAEGHRLRALVRRYSDHIAFPVRMRKDATATLEYEDVNQAQALWTRPRTEITDEEYRDFYRPVSYTHLYQLTRRNPRSDYFLSIQVSYPNDADVRRARRQHIDPGGAIMVHGWPNSLRHNAEYYACLLYTSRCV